ncbi:hypothetical protein ACSBR1_009688 [Camellia fascicularis]
MTMAGTRVTWTCASDRCFHFFPCLSDPARRSSLCLKLALVLLHLIYVGILFIFDKDLTDKTKREPWYTAIYLLLFVATLAQYFLTSCSSPGYVLDAMRAANETDALLRKTLLTSNVAVTVGGNQLGRNLLGSNATTWTKVVMEMYPPGSSVRSWTCTYCNIVQPPRTKHCHDCDKCVIEFDHHCVWLGTCIGQGNHCRFCYLVLTNQTTYELVRRRRIPYLRGIPERVYPFSKGACRNLYNFCCPRSSKYSLEPLPTAQEIEAKSKPYTCMDVLSCRCCCV